MAISRPSQQCPAISGHILSTFVPTQRAQCPRRPEQWLCRISSPMSPPKKPIQDHLPSRILLNQSSLSWETSPATVESLPNVTIRWPATSRHLQFITVPTWRTMSQVTWRVTLQSLPSVMAMPSAISRPPSVSNSTDSKVYVSWETWTMKCKVFYPVSVTMAISGTSSKYNFMKSKTKIPFC